MNWDPPCFYMLSRDIYSNYFSNLVHAWTTKIRLIICLCRVATLKHLGDILELFPKQDNLIFKGPYYFSLILNNAKVGTNSVNTELQKRKVAPARENSSFLPKVNE